MPTYQYTAKDNTGKTVTGVLDAASESAAANALRSVGLWPMRIEVTRRAQQAPWEAAPTPAAAPPVSTPVQVPAAPAGAPPAYLGAGAPPAAAPAGPPESVFQVAPQAGMPAPSQAPPPGGYSGVTAPAGPPYAGTATIASPVGQAATPDTAQGSVPLKQLAVYFRQLAASVHSGMPLSRCLEIVGQESRGKLSRISMAAATATQQGIPLSEVFARYPRAFSPLILAMLRAGERGGLLDVCLVQIADLLERQLALQQRISQQTFYPKLIIGASVFIMLATKMIISAVTRGQGSPYSSGFGGLLLPAIGGFVALYVLIKASASLGRNTRTLDSIKLSLPLIGGVTRRLATARFARAAAMLYGAGVPLAEVVDSSADASGNLVFAEGIRRATPAVMRGGRMSDALAPLQIFPSMAMSMLRTGEETGNIDEMLHKVADYCEAEAETSLRQMVAALQPICILLIAIVVGAEVIRFYTGYFGAIFKESGLE